MLHSSSRPVIPSTAPAGNKPDNKTPALARIIAERFVRRPRTVLVVGCGDGTEAAILAREFDASVTGVDMKDSFDPSASAKATLRVADATALPFADNSFDLVYSYHALEHIPKYQTALREMNRVLADGGNWCVGTPNRSRLIGYIGSKRRGLKVRLQSNIRDWKMRLKGQFRNECGAHAGFTATELATALIEAFGNAANITPQYYRAIYPRHASIIDLLCQSNAAKIIFPSVYFTGTRS